MFLWPISPWTFPLQNAVLGIVLTVLCRWKSAARWVRLGALAAGVTLFFVTPVDGWLTAALLFMLGIVLQIADWSKADARARVAAAGGVTLLVLIPFVLEVSSRVAEIDALRTQHPLVSIRERLAYEPQMAVASSGQSEDRDVPAWYRQMDLFVEEDKENPRAYEASMRTFSLGTLHSETYRAFVASPGFGLQRILRPSFGLIPRPPVRRRPLPAESPSEPGTGSQRRLEDEPPANSGPPAEQIAGVHRDARRSFLAPEAFGYVQDLDHVAGFEPHAFCRPFSLALDGNGPRSGGRWEVTTLQLVSLLKQTPPRVYESRELPDMARLSEFPTRPLDSFEAAALPRLETEEMVAEFELNRIHLLGGLRATRACLECHQVSEGTLLGAFRYVLSRTRPIAEPARSAAAL